MKVCIVDIHPACAGTREEAKLLLAEGVDVHVISPAENGGRPIGIPSACTWERGEGLRFAYPRLRRRLMAVDADAYHTHCSIPLMASVARIAGARYCADFNDIILRSRIERGDVGSAEHNIFDYVDHWARPLTETELNRMAAIDAILPPQIGSILDVGCGDGRITGRLATPDRFVVGVDESAIALSLHENLRARASMLHLPFGDAAFDAVTVLEVLEHLPTDVLTRSACEIARVAGEYVLIGVPLKETLPLRDVRCERCGHVFNQTGHLQRFSSQRLRGLIPGFRMIEFRECGADVRPYYHGGLLKLRQRGAGVYRRTARSVCPKCGLPLTPTDRTEVNTLSFLCNRINDRLRKWLPLSKSHCLALYRRLA
ncbi:MAG TPA: class I SAM-dependent methyltransferase [Phycisphaerae bacterium]|nr:class I SAM-dependent methyltransferase [Phycisphaerae bacterium]HRW52150.1 class I SAM-dependent methyltransferase [Phycisphaerae bacterium]